MTRSPADSQDTVDSAPTDESDDSSHSTSPAPMFHTKAVIAALADAGIYIDASTGRVVKRSTPAAAAADIALERAKPAATLRRFRRDPNLPAVKFVEDLFPETSLFKSLLNAVGIGDLANIVVVNRQFKKEFYDAQILTGRACMALTGQDCEPNPAEARKWYRVCADMHGTREAYCMLGGIANEGGASSVLAEMVSPLGEAAIDLDESERCLRAAIAADDSPPGSYHLLAPPDHALDAAKVDLAMTLCDKAWFDPEGTNAPYLLAQAGTLLDAVLDHDEVPSVHEVPFRYPRREAATLKAQMIQKGELAGTPADVLALIEAIPPDERDPNCDYLLGKIYMKLDEETPNDEHAARAFHHIHRAFEAGHPRTPFEMGQLAERGRGTDLSLSNAYFMYLRNAFHGGDGNERSIARLAEDVAAGPPYPPELIETMEDFDELRALAGDDDGPLDVEEAFAALGITAHLPSESDDDSDSEPDSEDTDERLLRIITS